LDGNKYEIEKLYPKDLTFCIEYVQNGVDLNSLPLVIDGVAMWLIYKTLGVKPSWPLGHEFFICMILADTRLSI